MPRPYQEITKFSSSYAKLCHTLSSSTARSGKTTSLRILWALFVSFRRLLFCPGRERRRRMPSRTLPWDGSRSQDRRRNLRFPLNQLKGRSRCLFDAHVKHGTHRGYCYNLYLAQLPCGPAGQVGWRASGKGYHLQLSRNPKHEVRKMTSSASFWPSTSSR